MAKLVANIMTDTSDMKAFQDEAGAIRVHPASGRRSE
jgi:hypothetical protein